MTLRVAIVGAGPAGIYAADILLKHEKAPDVSVDLFERLPAPYGLVRYGVAPDHPRIKAIVNSLQEVLDSGRIRLFGNVNYGTDITLGDLKAHYHSVVFATGAMRDAKLEIPGIDLPGSFGAADFVSWYDGHPDVPRDWSLEAKEVAVIGNGNVALDVARMLVKRPEDLYPTEVPPNVFGALESSKVTDVHIYGRRGPYNVKFTPLELRELGDLRDVDIILDEEDFGDDDLTKELTSSHKQAAVIKRVFHSWRQRECGGKKRRVHFHFFADPAEILGEKVVVGFRYRRTSINSGGERVADSALREQSVQAVYRAVGYFGSPLDDIPFDSDKGIIPNADGAVIESSGEEIPGLFVVGWIKRGPVGLIGHTKSDARETVESLLLRRRRLWKPRHTEADSIEKTLRKRGVVFTSLAGWHKLDLEELRRGVVQAKDRSKVVSREEMLAISRES